MDNLTVVPDGYPLYSLFHTVPYHSHVIIGLIMIVTLVLAVLGNGVVIYVFLSTRNLRTPSNMLVVNLAVADILMAVTGFPLLIVNSFKAKWAFPEWVCEFYGASATIFGLMSMNTLVFISLDRYVAIISPCHLTKVTYHHSKICILIVWIYSIMWGLLPVCGWSRYIVEGYGTTCSIDYFDREAPGYYFLLTMLLADYVVPCLIVMNSYIWIFLTVHRHNSSTGMMLTTGFIAIEAKDKCDDIPEETETSSKVWKPAKAKWSSTDYKMAKTLFIVVLCYLLAWTPYAVVTMIGQYGNVLFITPTLSMLPAVFAKFSTIYNPFIYSITQPRFKAEARAFIYRIFCHGRLPHGTQPVSGSHQHRSLEHTKSDSISIQMKQYPPSNASVSDRPCKGRITSEIKYSIVSSCDSDTDRELAEHKFPEQEPLNPASRSGAGGKSQMADADDVFSEDSDVHENQDRSLNLTVEERCALDHGLMYKRKLPKVISSHHTTSCMSKTSIDDALCRPARPEISGESLHSPNIEAIRVENNT